jgi:1,4-alpha-glucan branching enzyme
MSKNKPKSIEFNCQAPETQGVLLAGTFNEWDGEATPVKKGEDGNWDVTLKLPPGHHEYKFVVDGQWCCEPGCDGTNGDCPKCVSNQFGSMNRFIDVA